LSGSHLHGPPHSEIAGLAHRLGGCRRLEPFWNNPRNAIVALSSVLFILLCAPPYLCACGYVGSRAMSYRCACAMRVAVCCVLLPWRRPVALAPFLFSMTQEILLCLPSLRYSVKCSQATGLNPQVAQHRATPYTMPPTGTQAPARSAPNVWSSPLRL
jgi:hypothetical protein